ncbi:MAG TPA: hypothetical protein ENH84_04245, partial [Phycisphaerae bacterium]|nr:hypothetical protein [Phycisphaerae bacterium]
GKWNTKALLVARHDKLVCEWYSSDFGPEECHYTASMAKALVGGMSLALAMDDGLIDPDDLACKYVPAWKDDPVKSKITIRHLATHSSGIEDAITGDLSHKDHSGWQGDFWRQKPVDPFTISRDIAPMIFEPGSKYAYSNPGIAMLTYAVTAAISNSEHKDVRTLLRERIMEPIGAKDSDWGIGYGATYEIDGLKLVPSWGGGEFTARATALVGRLMLNRGNWDGTQLISPEIIDRVLAYAGMPVAEEDSRKENLNPGSGLSWWLNFDGIWPSMPTDAFAGAGAQHQLLIVIPRLDMIIVRNGPELLGGKMSWGEVEKYLFKPLMQAVTSPPYPYSKTISKLTWAPEDTIVRECSTPGGDGSDNWPLTWGDDDKQYTGYGDGYGFDYKDGDPKLSTGFAVVSGGPDDFTGVDIDSPAEQVVHIEGDPIEHHGAQGKKVCGMLMVDGVLYAWMRNGDENGQMCQLLWSKDHGRNWEWADWKLEEFGYCTFINYGQNYQGSRDDYVYMVSPDNPSAYIPADSCVLLRVPKDSIANRQAYEFLQNVADGEPVWTSDVSQKGAAFKNPGKCKRSYIRYNAPLGRYLWWQGPWQEDTDFRWTKSGFGVYDAPEPWGPWTTVYHTDQWDVETGESGNFPTKWISQDGLTMHLVFSGQDRFSVRKASLELRS